MCRAGRARKREVREQHIERATSSFPTRVPLNGYLLVR